MGGSGLGLLTKGANCFTKIPSRAVYARLVDRRQFNFTAGTFTAPTSPSFVASRASQLGFSISGRLRRQRFEREREREREVD